MLKMAQVTGQLLYMVIKRLKNEYRKLNDLFSARLQVAGLVHGFLCSALLLLSELCTCPESKC